MAKSFSTEESKKIAAKLGANFSKRGQSQFKRGMDVELEHGTKDQVKGLDTNETNDNPTKTGRIALAHLKEVPGYYTALDKMEKTEKKKKELSVIKKHI